MQVDFTAADCKWELPSKASSDEGRLDELHVYPKAGKARKQLCVDLRSALESGESVSVAGCYNATKYVVRREEFGTFVLVNSGGIRVGNSRVMRSTRCFGR